MSSLWRMSPRKIAEPILEVLEELGPPMLWSMRGWPRAARP
jgi:hypothetical protein